MDQITTKYSREVIKEMSQEQLQNEVLDSLRKTGKYDEQTVKPKTAQTEKQRRTREERKVADLDQPESAPPAGDRSEQMKASSYAEQLAAKRSEKASSFAESLPQKSASVQVLDAQIR